MRPVLTEAVLHAVRPDLLHQELHELLHELLRVQADLHELLRLLREQVPRELLAQAVPQADLL